MRAKKIDLTIQPEGCVNPPIVRLTRAIRELKQGEEIEVVYKEDLIPLKTLQLLSRKYGLILIQISSNKCILKREES